MVTCETTGLVTLQPNARLCRHKCMAVARGVATMKPDEKFMVNLCNIGPDLVTIRKGRSVAFADPHGGQILTVPFDEENPPPKVVIEGTRNALHDSDLNDAPEYLRKQIEDMLDKHGKL